MSEFPETRSSLLALVRSPGNLKAWEDFVLLYRPVIYRMARRRGMQDADAQDATQAVLARVAGAIGRWEKRHPETRFRHWLRRVAKNAMLTALARGPRPGLGQLDTIEVAGRSEELEREIELESMRERYLRAARVVRGDVDADTWKAFELTVIGGLSCEAAAASLDRSVGAVYAARSRVMRRLREQVSDQFGIEAGTGERSDP